MVTGIIGKKVGMTQVFDPDGTVHPATVIKAGPCVVVQAKTAQTDGYEAVQLGLVEETPAKANKPTKGHFKKANVPATRVRREVKVTAGAPETPNVGDQVLASIFDNGERVECRQPAAARAVRASSSATTSAGGAPRRNRSTARPGRLRVLVPVARHQGHARRRDGWAAAA